MFELSMKTYLSFRNAVERNYYQYFYETRFSMFFLFLGTHLDASVGKHAFERNRKENVFDREDAFRCILKIKRIRMRLYNASGCV